MPIETDSTTNLQDDISLLESEEIQKPESEEEKVELKVEAPEIEEDLEEKSEPEAKKEEEKEEEEPETPPKELAPHERPSIAQIREKYPEFFKDFPQLRDVYFREKEYSSLFPTIDEAKDALSNSQALEGLRESAFAGDPSKIYQAVNDSDPKAFDKFTQNLLPSLMKMSPDAHWKAIHPLLENLARSFYGAARDDNQKNAALILSNYLFNDEGSVAKGEKSFVKTSVEEIPERARELDQRERDIESRRFSSFEIPTRSTADSKLRELIDNKKHIDPEGVMSNFVRSSVVERVVKEINDQMVADKTHMQYMNSLWNRAKKAGYTDDWKARIIDAYLARAKSLIPAVRSKFVSEALGTSQKAADRKNERVSSLQSRKEGTGGGRPASNGSKTYDPKKVDWSKTSDDDFLNDNITFKQ